MQKFDTRESELVSFSMDKYTLSDKNGELKTFNLEGKSQKDVIQFLIKINGKTQRETAQHLEKIQHVLLKTLIRENLSYEAFVQIYKFATGEDFKTGFDFWDDLNGLYHLKVKDVVNLLHEENMPFIVRCGSYFYKIVNS